MARGRAIQATRESARESGTKVRLADDPHDPCLAKEGSATLVYAAVVYAAVVGTTFL
jgi:hypothetical protein